MSTFAPTQKLTEETLDFKPNDAVYYIYASGFDSWDMNRGQPSLNAWSYPGECNHWWLKGKEYGPKNTEIRKCTVKEFLHMVYPMLACDLSGQMHFINFIAEYTKKYDTKDLGL